MNLQLIRNINFKNAKRVGVSLAMAALLSSCGGMGGSLPNFGGGGDSGLDQDKGQVVDISKPVVVALLVPTGAAGGLGEVGRSLENSGRLAAQLLNKDEIDLRVYSTQGNPAMAQQMAKQAESEGASIIVGPLKSEEVGPITAVTNLPILSFSNNTEVAGGNVYVLGTTFENVAERVIGFEKAQGGKNLGIVFQNDIAGTQGAKATSKVAQSNGVKIVANEGYVLTQEDITAAGPRIAGSLKQSGADMVMFTDHPNGGLGFVGAALAQSGYTSADAKYMGLSQWQDFAAQLSQSGFNGGIFALPDPVRSSQFRARYQQSYGQDPHDIGGLAYDAVQAAILLVRDARKTNDKTPFSSKDVNGLAFKGALGAVKMKSHRADRALAVMRLNGDSVSIVSAAPGSM